MITKEIITKIIDENFIGTDKFIVDVRVGGGNKIVIEIDSEAGVKVSDCVSLHRFIESKLNRDVEDFDLTVSSPGIEEPFKILLQYKKYVGKGVRVVLNNGIVNEGRLKAANEKGIEISQEKMEKINKKKHYSINQIPILFEQIKKTSLI